MLSRQARSGPSGRSADKKFLFNRPNPYHFSKSCFIKKSQIYISLAPLRPSGDYDLVNCAQLRCWLAMTSKERSDDLNSCADTLAQLPNRHFFPDSHPDFAHLEGADHPLRELCAERFIEGRNEGGRKVGDRLK